MCPHKNLVYIGEQEINDKGETFSLYNCKDCHTTLMIKKNEPYKKARIIEERINTS